LASAIVRTAEALRLLGTQTVLTGISPEMARTFVELQIDLRPVMTRGTLQSGFAYAISRSDLPH
jgi:anti-anti-sigma regulatory factor